MILNTTYVLQFDKVLGNLQTLVYAVPSGQGRLPAYPNVGQYK